MSGNNNLAKQSKQNKKSIFYPSADVTDSKLDKLSTRNAGNMLNSLWLLLLARDTYQLIHLLYLHINVLAGVPFQASCEQKEEKNTRACLPANIWKCFLSKFRFKL